MSFVLNMFLQSQLGNSFTIKGPFSGDLKFQNEIKKNEYIVLISLLAMFDGNIVKTKLPKKLSN